MPDDRHVIHPKFHHVNLKTTRLQEMIDWYATSSAPRCSSSTTSGPGSPTTRPTTASRCWRSRTSSTTRKGHAHRAAPHGLRVRQLRGAQRDLPAAAGGGIEPDFCLDHGMTFSYYYRDPDGNHVELQVDNFGDWAKSKRVDAREPEFHEDPIGKFVDPDRVAEAAAAGARSRRSTRARWRASSRRRPRRSSSRGWRRSPGAWQRQRQHPERTDMTPGLPG